MLEFASVAATSTDARSKTPKNLAHVHAALYAVTGHRLAVTTTLAEAPDGAENADQGPVDEGSSSLCSTTSSTPKEVEDT